MFEAGDINTEGAVDVKEFLSWLLLPDDPGEAENRIIKRLSVLGSEREYMQLSNFQLFSNFKL
jgi:hypothetical protein